jgi:hypothetical protein
MAGLMPTAAVRLSHLERDTCHVAATVAQLRHRFTALSHRLETFFTTNANVYPGGKKQRQRPPPSAEALAAKADRVASHWLDLGAQLGDDHRRGRAILRGRLTLCGAPSSKKLKELVGMGADHVVTLLRSDEGMGNRIQSACIAAQIGWTHLPLSGGGVRTAEDVEVVGRLSLVVDLLHSGRSVVVHCAAGMHRTGVVAYILLRLCGYDRPGAVEGVRTMRRITHTELTQARRPGKLIPDTHGVTSLADHAERLFIRLFPVARQLGKRQSGSLE